MKTLLIIIFCFASASCATGYHKYSWTGGYRDTDLGDGVYIVEYQGNGTTSAATVDKYWEQRANELCEKGFVVLKGDEGANDGAAWTGSGMPIAHPWKKGKIQCN